MAALGGLSLAVGVAVAETLRAQGASRVGLKWPNDLVAAGAKLGGVLVEIARGADGGTVAVVGVGVNGSLGPRAAAIDQPWTDLATLLGTAPDRNRLAGAVLAALMDAMTSFDAQGLAPFRTRYAVLDSLAGRPVRVLDQHPFDGVARGVDDDGALLVDDGRARRRVMAGDVSVRAVAGNGVST
ncbi:MAG: biotin--[acetyl-CoA-carboxylase] ligase [Planctomycetes bacterium]|nr:biotin--[acetyl-CoA-carboxylase] ligase [Planctomycetota bacterium]